MEQIELSLKTICCENEELILISASNEIRINQRYLKALKESLDEILKDLDSDYRIELVNVYGKESVLIPKEVRILSKEKYQKDKQDENGSNPSLPITLTVNGKFVTLKGYFEIDCIPLGKLTISQKAEIVATRFKMRENVQLGELLGLATKEEAIKEIENLTAHGLLLIEAEYSKIKSDLETEINFLRAFDESFEEQNTKIFYGEEYV